jgi:predicted dehydrogenase
MERIDAVMVGAGHRGNFSYGPYAERHPDELRFLAVADPIPARRDRFGVAHDIPAERRFAHWEELFARGPMAQACFVTSPDRDHHDAALAAMETGYEVLLEKPLAPTLAETVDLVQVSERMGRSLHVGKVLRYAPFFTTLHQIVASGRLGDIITVEHRENVAYFHMAHSFVRGNWSNAGRSSPMILAKCCHDFDILVWNLGRPVGRLQSFGSLIHFRPDQAPDGATARCTDGCPAGPSCPFDARRIYLSGWTGWPVNTITEDLTPEGIERALRTGPYGRCVYQSDNNVVDHQTVNMELEDGASVVLVMHGHSHEEGRTMRYDGTRATLRGRFGLESSLEVHDHLTGTKEEIEIPPATSGHGGGDFGLVRAFLQAVRGEETSLATARQALESHLLAFAAEESRLSGSVVDMERFRQRALGEPARAAD